MSRDGFIADPSGDVGPLFDWYFSGGVEVRTAGPWVFNVSEPSAKVLRGMFEDCGALVVGRSEVRHVVARQALEAGLLDEVWVSLVPVLLGQGIRYFGDLEDPPVLFETPHVVQADGVTHLTYRVRRAETQSS